MNTFMNKLNRALLLLENENNNLLDIVLSPLKAKYNKTASKLKSFVLLPGKGVSKYDELETRLQELADNKRLVAEFLPSSSNTKPEDIGELPSQYGKIQHRAGIFVFRKDNIDVAEVMNIENWPAATIHAIRGIAFGFELDDIMRYALSRSYDQAWKQILDDDGWVLAERKPHGHASVYRNYNNIPTGSISVLYGDMDVNHFAAKAEQYGDKYAYYDDGPWQYCRKCASEVDAISRRVLDSDDNGHMHLSVRKLKCEHPPGPDDEFSCIVILNKQTQDRINELILSF